jgi:hypothetical protein
MGNIDWVLELVLVALLGVTLVHAVRLERALRILRQDRTALGEAIAGFDDSARQAETGIAQLQSATAESAQLLGRRLDQGTTLKDDLAFLLERGETLADRLDGLVRTGRTITAPPSPAPAPTPAFAAEPVPKVRSQAERELLAALRGAQ